MWVVGLEFGRSAKQDHEDDSWTDAHFQPVSLQLSQCHQGHAVIPPASLGSFRLPVLSGSRPVGFPGAGNFFQPLFNCPCLQASFSLTQFWTPKLQILLPHLGTEPPWPSITSAASRPLFPKPTLSASRLSLCPLAPRSSGPCPGPQLLRSLSECSANGIYI